MKVGLATPYVGTNYGTKLQSYALQTVIRSMGHETEIIKFPKKKNQVQSIKKLFSADRIKHRIKLRMNQTNMMDQRPTEMVKKRKKAIDSLDSIVYELAPQADNYTELKSQSGQFDAIICGSDQIWLPFNVEDGFFTLTWAEKGVKRISYAASLGVSELSHKNLRMYQRFLRKMDSISVRESEGRNLINGQVEQEVPVVLDPTLLAPRAVWDEYQSYGEIPVRKEPYLLCYFLGTNEEHRNEAKRIAREKHLKILNFAHFKGYTSADQNFADEDLYEVNPADFVRLIGNASYVCTDSFHASVFSIIYHRNFTVFERFREGDKASTNSRIRSLLQSVHLTQCLYGDREYKKMPVVYDTVDQTLADIRQKSFDFISQALK